MVTPLIVHRSFKESLTGETLREGTRNGVRAIQIKTNDGDMFDISEGEFNLLMANPTLEYKHIGTKINDDDEVVTQPAININGVWEPVDEKGNIISNPKPTKQRMVVQKFDGPAPRRGKYIPKPWTLTNEKSVLGEQVWAKTGKGKNGPTLIMGVPGEGGVIKRVSARYVYTGQHPPKGPSRRKSTRMSRPHHVGGATRKEFALARKKFLAAETPGQRRGDRKTTETLVYNADEYNPKVNDFPGIDEAGWNQRARWNSKSGDYVVPKKRVVGEYQRSIMAWNRAKRMAKKYGLPEPSKPARVGPAPQKYIRKADRIAVASAAGPMLVDRPSMKRGFSNDDDNDTYDPTDFRGRNKYTRTF